MTALLFQLVVSAYLAYLCTQLDCANQRQRLFKNSHVALEVLVFLFALSATSVFAGK